MPTTFPMANPWVHGELVDEIKNAARVTTPINDLYALVAALGTFSSYTPTLTATTTNPTLGTASVQMGQYTQIGKLVIGDAFISFGTSGAAAGSGAYFVSLPVAAVLPSPQTAYEVGSFSLSAAGLATRGFALLQSASTVNLRYTSTAINGTLTTVTNAAPGVFTNNDNIRVHFAYQAA